MFDWIPRFWWHEIDAQGALDLNLSVRRNWQGLSFGWHEGWGVTLFVRPTGEAY